MTRLRASPQVACPHFPDCVGCPLVGQPYGVQLQGKQSALDTALAAHPTLRSLGMEKPIGSPRAFGYRNHAKLVFRRRRARGKPDVVLLGVYRPGTHSVAPAERCIVHDRLLQPVLAALRREVERMHIPIFDERTRLGELRYALARSSRWKGRVHLTLVVAVREPTWAAELLRRLQRGGTALESAFLSFNATPGNVLLGAQVRSVFGPRSLIERLGVLELESTPNAFLQANPAVAERVYENAARWLQIGSTEEVLDVYCGVGAIGLTVCGDAQRLLGIEASPAAIDCAGRNARRLRRPLARFVTGRAEDLLSIAHAHEMTPSTVLLNPPRRGLGPGVVDALAALGPRQIAYVSCDPTSLARDLTALAERGFEPTRVRLFDMLPQTLHVEALALLVRRASASKAPTAKPGTRTDRTRRRAQRRVP